MTRPDSLQKKEEINPELVMGGARTANSAEEFLGGSLFGDLFGDTPPELPQTPVPPTLPAVPQIPLPSVNQMFGPPSGLVPTVVQQQPNPNVINLQNLDPRSHTLLPPPQGTKPAPPGMVNKIILLPTSEPNKFMQVQKTRQRIQP